MRIFFSFLAFLLCSYSVFANDSTAQFATGGLKLQKSSDIAMLSEKLTIDFNQIEVSYVFENQSNQDIHTIVAFPMPEIKAAEYEQDLPSLHTEQPTNFLNFQAQVDGKSIKPQIEIRAFGMPEFEKEDETENDAKIKKPPREVTALLKRHGLLLSPFDPAFSKKISNLSNSAFAELKKQGLLVNRSRQDAAWTVKISLYWNQVFPAHQKVKVFHRYDTALASSLAGHLDEKEYCVDQGTQKAIQNLKVDQGDQGVGMSNRYIDYVLKTGANWKGPIGQFQLIIDKNKPNNILSFCMPGKGLTLKKISPTQFEITGSQFTPLQDLHLGFLIAQP